MVPHHALSVKVSTLRDREFAQRHREDEKKRDGNYVKMKRDGEMETPS